MDNNNPEISQPDIVADDVVVNTDEINQDVPLDANPITLDMDEESLPLPSETSEKSVLEDNDFIHSCSSLDDTVKEILEDEEPISPKKIAEDPDATICNEEDDDIKIPQDIVFSDNENSLNIDEDQFKSGGEFQLDLDYLENLSSASEDNEYMSDLARQSLYVKFDPLVGAVTKKNKEKEAVPKMNQSDMLFTGPAAIAGSDLLVLDTPPKKSVQRRAVTKATPSDRDQKQESNEAQVDQLFDLSPKRLDLDVLDQDFTKEDTTKCNGNNINGDHTLIQPLIYSKKDLDDAVSALMTQWKEENAISELEMEEKTATIEKLKEKNAKSLAEINEMKVVMSEYEQTMAQMIEDRENEKSSHAKSNSEIIQERDQLQHDLINTEKSFAHIHTRFEKLKTVVITYKKNEEICKKAVKDLQENLKKSEEKYQLLKKHAEEKLAEANAEITRLQTSNKNEVTVLQAALKKERAKATSLEQSLNQKINENKELTAICDELIGKVEPSQ